MDVEPLRVAFLASGRSACSVARELKWEKSGGAPDANRVRRALGLAPYHQGRGQRRRLRERCGYDRFVELARAIGVDPVDLEA